MERKDEWQLVGSRYFFDNIPEFKPHDSDYVMLEENPTEYNIYFHIIGHNECRIKWKWMSCDNFIDYTNNHGLPMQVGKFLVPEFNEKIGLTIDDLNKLRPSFDLLDEKHKYEKVIFDFYLENGGFFLTDKQRMKAFEEYKKERNE